MLVDWHCSGCLRGTGMDCWHLVVWHCFTGMQAGVQPGYGLRGHGHSGRHVVVGFPWLCG